MAFSQTRINKAKSNHKVSTALLIPLAGIIIFCMIMALSTRFIYIYDGDKMIAFKTYSEVNDVSKFLYKNGIEVTTNDLVEVKKTNPFTEVIKITRSFPIKVTADSGTTTMMLRSGQVGSVLDKLDISIDSDDLLNYDLTAEVYDGMEIVVRRVSYETQVLQELIPFSVRQIKDNSIPAGKTVKVSDGNNGILEKKALNKYIDGMLVHSEKVYETVLKKPISGVIKFGTWGDYTSRKGDNFRYSRVLEVTATAYTFGEGGTRTATGKPVAVGLVAVDPKVIPLGSRLYIESPSGGYIYGFAVAEDTGGAIKGLKIDVFVESKLAAKNFGRRKMRVYVLSEG